MRTLIIYNSSTGFTKRYAYWLQEEIEADVVSINDEFELDVYDQIVFVGWAHGGTIKGLSWFKKKIEGIKDKTLVVFCVGASPIGNEDIADALENNLPSDTYGHIHRFYCPGGINYSKMPLTSKMMMRGLVGFFRLKRNKTQKEIEMAEMISKSYDISDKKYLDPIIEVLVEKSE